MKWPVDITRNIPTAVAVGWLLAMVLTAVLLYFGTGFFPAVTREQASSQPAATLPYDGYSEGIHTVWYDETGLVSHVLRAERQLHYKDSSSRLEQPFIQLFGPGESHWDIVAARGKMAPLTPGHDAKNSIIELSGAVEFHHFDQYGNRTVLTTESVSINTGEETVATDQPVQMKTTHIEQTALGLLADLSRNEIRFLQDSTGRYEPAAGN